MEFSELKEDLIEQARSNNVCEEGYHVMQSRNMDGLIAYYLQNIDWCLERGFPDLQTLSTQFANIQDKGVYVNAKLEGEMLNDLQVYVFHNCKGHIRVGLNIEKAIIPMLYFANDCDVVVECGENIKVPLYVFGNNTVAINNKNAFKIYKEKVLKAK